MEMKDPVAVYSPRTLAEGQALAQMLDEAGIPAQVVMEEVVVAKADSERAAEALMKFEQTRAEGGTNVPAGNPQQTFVTAVCEECGESSMFAGTLLGTVQDCPHCGRFMDVAAAGEDLDWGEPEEEANAEPDEE
jgi:hypothetical protein